ncbi:MAG TPA: hypothetical protein VK988_04320 [Acidimicrobiales bacterium]|nr:hypothetical protein [Acidimicrobiales bacterium]
MIGVLSVLGFASIFGLGFLLGGAVTAFTLGTSIVGIVLGFLGFRRLKSLS